jgi:hypothetical protein
MMEGSLKKKLRKKKKIKMKMLGIEPMTFGFPFSHFNGGYLTK